MTTDRYPTPKRPKAWFGWCLYDWANSAFATVILAAVLPVYFVHLVPEGGADIFWSNDPVPASVLWGYGVSLSMLLVAGAAPVLGALGDRGGQHQYWMGLFCFLGATCTAALFLAHDGRYRLAISLFIVANFAFAAANIFYNALLPVLAGNEKDMDRLSAHGFALGYVGGGVALLVVVLLVSFPSLFGLPGTGLATRIGFVFTGLWWLVFTIPTLWLLQGIRAPKRQQALPSGLRGYGRILKEVTAYPDLLRFLIAFLLYNDGIQAVIALSAVFAKDVLELPRESVIGCFLMVQFMAMPGALVCGWLAGKYGAKRIILFTLALFMVATGFAATITVSWQFWALGFVVALILGGSQAASRSLFASLIPAGRNAEFFGFYAISAKFASILGPFLFALFADLTGSPRLSILVLIAFFALGALVLSTVKPERGRLVVGINRHSGP
ncbi:MAG: MFS transporter [Desulfovermiculus sp.]|nr:MFS transporter [Desulfovermiculus sp.]